MKRRSGLIVVHWGGGDDSTSLICGMAKYGIRPDLILNADPGSEHPRTYSFIKIFSEYLASVDFPPITTVYKVDKQGERYTLEQNCLDISSLPSIAYGHKKCSQKFKIEPQDKFLNNWAPARAAWKRGEKVNRVIGYNASEPERMRFPSPTRLRNGKWVKNPDYYKYDYWYPLIEDLNWTKADCIREIKRAGLPSPGKSACTFCPSSKVPEIIKLSQEYPDLAKRALAIESKAKSNLHSVKGLGRSFAWSEVLGNGDIEYLSLFEPPKIDCYCGV